MPGFRGGDVNARRAVVLPGVLQCPLVDEQRIIDRCRQEDHVGLDPGDGLLVGGPADDLDSRGSRGVQGKTPLADRLQLPAGADLDRQALDSRVPAADPIVVPHCRHDASVDVGYPVGQRRSRRHHWGGGKQLPRLQRFSRQPGGAATATGTGAIEKR